MVRRLTVTCLLLSSGWSLAGNQVGAKETVPPAPFVQQLTEVLARAESGHSPTPDEIMAAESDPGLTQADIALTLAPLLRKALGHGDAAVRQYALAMLVGTEVLPDASAEPAPASVRPAEPAAQPASGSNRQNKAAPSPNGPAAFHPDVAQAFTPLIPLLAGCLADERPENRELAATDLGGFAPSPPQSVYPPLLGYLKRDEAVGPVGLQVVSDLLQFGHVSDRTAAAIIVYLRRSDQSADSRANLVEAIAGKPNQSQSINKALLEYLDSDDPALRARVILSLPLLDLTPEVFADTKSRVSDLANGGGDTPQVIRAARSVAGCWTAVRMTTGCPSF